jgi:hypothetical protein
MALRNRKNQEEKKLIGVNRVADPTKIKLGMFESLQNFIPGKRYKIKKKRGVEALVDSPPAPVIPSNCEICVAAAPGEQELPVECCYDVTDGWENVTSNHHGMFAHATDAGDFWFTISENTGFGVGTYPTLGGTSQWYLLEPVSPGVPDECDLQEVTPDALAGGRTLGVIGQSPRSGTCGKSDERSYFINALNVSPVITIDAVNYAELFFYLGETSGESWFVINNSGSSVFANDWCKFGDYFYSVFENNADSGAAWLGRWPVPSPSGAKQDLDIALDVAMPGWNDAAMGLNVTFNRNIGPIHATANYVYVIGYSAGGWTDSPTNSTRLYRLNASDLTYSTHWVLDSDHWGMHVFSDDLIFLARGRSAPDWTFEYFLPADGTTHLIGTVPWGTCTDSGYSAGWSAQHGFYYAKNYFYLSYSGFGLGTTNVLKIGPLLCPGHSDILWDPV